METKTTIDVCRVTVVGWDRQVDLALPVDLALGDLAPVVLGHLTTDTDERAASRGVVLQRLGGPPLDEMLTPQQHGLRDGDVLHARPADAALPPASVDDLVAGIAERISDRTSRWSPGLTRLLCQGLVVVALGLGAALLVRGGPPLAAALVAGGVTLLVVAAVALYARWLDEPRTAVLLGLVAVGYGALAGVLALEAGGGPAPGTAGPPTALWAAGGGLAVAALVRVVSTSGQAVLLGVLASGGFACLGALLTLLAPLTTVQATVVVTSLALLLSPLVPATAFRLAGLRVPDVPVSAEDVGRDVEPAADPDMADRSAVTDRYATALYVSLGAVSAAAVTLLAFAPGWSPPVFAVLVCVLLLLRYRVLDATWQRLAVMLPAAYGAVLLVWRVSGSAPPPVLLGVGVGTLVLLAAGLLAGARLLPGRPVRPYWGRAAEIGESLAAAVLVPVGLAVLGLYELALGVGA